MPMKNSLKSFLAAVLTGPAIALCAHCAEFDVTRYGAKADGTALPPLKQFLSDRITDRIKTLG